MKLVTFEVATGDILSTMKPSGKYTEVNPDCVESLISYGVATNIHFMSGKERAVIGTIAEVKAKLSDKD